MVPVLCLAASCGMPFAYGTTFMPLHVGIRFGADDCKLNSLEFVSDQALHVQVCICGGGALARLPLELRLGSRWRLGIESIRCSHSGFHAGVEGAAAILFRWFLWP